MQVFFALFVSLIGSYIILNSVDDNLNSVKATALYRSQYKKYEVMDALSYKVRLAYDRAQQTSGCLAGSAELGGLTNSSKLCWSDLSGGCFDGILFARQQVCLAKSQTYARGNFGFISKAHASLYPNVKDYNQGNYSASTAIKVPVASSSGGFGSATAAKVVLPTENGVNSNFINCARSHTECLTLTFCTNGSRTCSGKNRVTQTFAFRHF